MPQSEWVHVVVRGGGGASVGRVVTLVQVEMKPASYESMPLFLSGYKVMAVKASLAAAGRTDFLKALGIFQGSLACSART